MKSSVWAGTPEIQDYCRRNCLPPLPKQAPARFVGEAERDGRAQVALTCRVIDVALQGGNRTVEPAEPSPPPRPKTPAEAPADDEIPF